MSEPKRIQRKRTKGWRMPEGAIYVGRPTLFGNPFVFGGSLIVYPEQRQKVIDNYRRWLAGELSGNGVAGGLRRIVVMARIPELRGKDLACWCPIDQPCHADVLLKLANQ